jgi:hypothetical protein
MRKRGFVRKFAFLAFFFGVASMGFGFEEIVFCFGEDGHRGIEFLASCHNQKSKNILPPNFAKSHPSGEGSPCFDFLITNLATRSSLLQGGSLESAELPAFSLYPNFFIKKNLQFSFRFLSNLNYPTLKNIKTVTLLI